VNLMDALRQSIGSDTAAKKPAAKKPPKSEKEPAAARRGIGLVKAPAKTASKRKSA
jgi:hypothetical protein